MLFPSPEGCNNFLPCPKYSSILIADMWSTQHFPFLNPFCSALTFPSATSISLCEDSPMYLPWHTYFPTTITLIPVTVTLAEAWKCFSTLTWYSSLSSCTVTYQKHCVIPLLHPHHIFTFLRLFHICLQLYHKKTVCLLLSSPPSLPIALCTDTCAQPVCIPIFKTFVFFISHHPLHIQNAPSILHSSCRYYLQKKRTPFLFTLLLTSSPSFSLKLFPEQFLILTELITQFPTKLFTLSHFAFSDQLHFSIPSLILFSCLWFSQPHSFASFFLYLILFLSAASFISPFNHAFSYVLCIQ